MRPATRDWLAIAVAATLCAGCAPVLQQYFADTYYDQDRVYQNEGLGFALMFAPGWRVMTDPNKMNKPRRTVAQKLYEQGAELIFAGETVEGSQGTRGIVENLNKTNDEFLAAVRAANAASLEKDLGHTTFVAGDELAVKWEYLFSGLHYVEFLFRAGTYNVRVAFWAKPDRFKDFLPVYEDIMTTLDLDP